jgi:hypothetical protein
MNRVDEILSIIDTGLQTAGDTAYGNDGEGLCWRCGDPSPDLCESCRDELVAETVVVDKVPATKDGYITFLLSLPIGPFVTALEGLIVAFDHLSHDLRRRIVEIVNEEGPLS